MKRTFFVSALVLTLMVLFCGEAFSLAAPYGTVDPGAGGDDHTWGGDFQVSSDDQGGIYAGDNSGFIPLDMIITTILFRWLDMNSFVDRSVTEADIFIQNQILDTEPAEPVTSPNTGGLQ